MLSSVLLTFFNQYGMIVAYVPIGFNQLASYLTKNEAFAISRWAEQMMMHMISLIHLMFQNRAF